MLIYFGFATAFWQIAHNIEAKLKLSINKQLLHFGVLTIIISVEFAKAGGDKKINECLNKCDFACRFNHKEDAWLSEGKKIPKNKTKRDKGRHQNSLGLFPVDL